MIGFAIISKGANQIVKNRLLLLSCVLWVTIFGFRDYGVQNDTSPYATFISGKIYDGSLYGTDYGTADNPVDEIEIGYVLFCRLFTFFSNSPTLYFLLVASWLFTFIYIIYKKVNPNYSIWSLALLFTIQAGTISVLMGSMRQVLSFCLLLSGFMLFDREKTKILSQDNQINVKWYKNYRILLSIILMFITVIIHRSALFTLLLFVLLLFIKLSKKQSYFLLFISFIISVIFKEFLSIILDFFFAGITNSSNEMIETMSRYGESLDEEGISVFARFTRFIIALLVIYYIDDENKNSIYFRCFVIANVLFLVFSTSYIVARITMFFNLIGYAIIIPKDIKNKKTAQFFYIMITILFTYKAYDLFESWPIYKDTFLPYHFVWE